MMKKFMILYRSSVSAGEQMASGSPEDAQAGMELWMTWAGKAGDAIVDLGSPLTRVSAVGGGDSGQPIGGFSILQAESEEAVKGLLDGHPHFHSPGDPTIEILEFLPIPGA
jgi:hypothetical protein